MADKQITPQSGKKVEELVDEQLGENAMWKMIQQRTFTRWVNKHISRANKQIDNLRDDLSDGIRLISLIEVCSSRQFSKYNRRPTTRIHRIENVSIVLDYLAKEENVRLVNIDCVDIVDGKIKLICGLVWTLVKHYDISIPVWDGEEETPADSSPRKRLLAWITNKVPELCIRNFTSDWADGRALGALVDAVAPGLCPDWEDFQSEDALQNISKAMDLAQKWLGCELLISPDDLIHPALDEQSMMTYLSQFPIAKLKEGAPLSRRCNPNRIRVYGSGVQSGGAVCGVECQFTVDTFSAGEGKLQITATGPNGQQVPIHVKYNNDQHKTYTCRYKPEESGEYKIEVKYAGQQVPRSPFVVKAERAQIEINRVRVSGETLTGKSQPQVGRLHVLELDACEAGIAMPDVQLFGPNGKQLPIKIKQRHCDQRGEEVTRITIEEELEETEEVQIERYVYTRSLSKEHDKHKQTVSAVPTAAKKSLATNKRKDSLDSVPVKDVRPMSKYWLEYVCEEEGEHRMEVKYGGIVVPNSPFKLHAKRGLDVTKVRTEGSGVGNQIRIGQEVNFKVDQSEAGQGQLTVNVVDSTGKRLPVQMIQVTESVVKDKTNKSEVKSTAKTAKQSKDVNKTAEVDQKKSDSVEGQLVTECSYTARTDGKHEVQILLDGQHVLGSPFEVEAKSGANRAKVFGSGLQRAQQNARSTIAVLSNGEPGPVECKIAGPGQVQINCRPDIDNPQLTLIDYVCDQPGDYELQLTIGGQPLPDSPYRIQVRPVDCHFRPEKARLVLEPPADACVGRPSRFSVDLDSVVDESAQHPNALLHVLRLDELCEKVCKPLATESVAELNSPLQPNRKRAASLVEFEYVPAKQGRHLLWLECDGVSAGGRPLQLNVRAAGEPGKICITGQSLQQDIWALGERQTIQLEIDEQKTNGRLEVWVVDLRSGRPLPVRMEQVDDRKFEAHFRPCSAGKHRLLVTLDGQPVPGTPATYSVQAPFDVQQVRVQHLHTTAYVNSVNSFIVDTRELSEEHRKKLRVQCELRDEQGLLLPTHVRELPDGRHEISYEPHTSGNVQAQVYVNRCPILPQSTKVEVRSTGNEPQRVRISSIEESICGRINQMIVDTRNAGQGVPSVQMRGPGGCEAQLVDNQDGTYLLEYGALEPGDYELSIQFAGKQITPSPLKVKMHQNEKEIGSELAQKVKVFGLDTLRSKTDNRFIVDASAVQKPETEVQITPAAKTTVVPKKKKTSESAKPEDVPSSSTEKQIAPKPLVKANAEIKTNQSITPNLINQVGDTVGPLTVTSATDSKKALPPPSIRKQPDGTYQVNVPVPEAGANCAVQVEYAGVPVDGSAFIGPVKPPIDVKKVQIESMPVQVNASLPTQFSLDASSAGPGQTCVSIEGPQGKPCEARVTEQNGHYKVEYTPEEIGKYKVTCCFDGTAVNGFPATVEAKPIGDATKCALLNVKQLPSSLLTQQEMLVLVDTKDAGPGRVTARIKPIDNQKSTAKPGPSKKATKSPSEANELRPSLSTLELNSDGSRLVDQGTIVNKTKTTSTKTEDKTKIENRWTVRSEDLQDGTQLVSYRIDEEGEYEVELMFGGRPLPNTKRRVQINRQPPQKPPQQSQQQQQQQQPKQQPSTTGKKVSKTSKQIIEEEEEEEEITIEESIEYVRRHLRRLEQQKSKAPVVNKSSTTTTTSNAKTTEEKVIKEKSKDTTKTTTTTTTTTASKPSRKTSKEIKPEDDTTAVQEDLLPLNPVELCELPFTLFPDSKRIRATIQTPDGREVPAQVIPSTNGNLIRFNPNLTGRHRLQLFYEDSLVESYTSVFEVQRQQTQQPYARGRGLISGQVGQPCDFQVTIPSDADHQLTVSVFGPTDVELTSEQVGVDTQQISWIPKKPGLHRIQLLCDGKPVAGSPFTVTIVPSPPNVQVEMRPNPTQQVRINRNTASQTTTNRLALLVRGQGLNKAIVNSENKFEIENQSNIAGCARVLVEGPARVELRTERLSTGQEQVTYVPKVAGRYLIHISFDEQPLPGSPFSVQATGTDQRKRQCVEQKHQLRTERLEINKRKQVTITTEYTEEEIITATMITPSGKRKQIRLQRTSDQTKENQDRSTVWRTLLEEEEQEERLQEEGEYQLWLQDRQGNPLPDRPVRFFVSKDGSSKRTTPINLQLSGQGLRHAVVGEQTYFTIVPDGEANLSVKLEGPGQCELQLRETQHSGVYEACYVLHEEGSYTLHLLVDGRPANGGTPLRILAVRRTTQQYESQESSQTSNKVLNLTSKQQTSLVSKNEKSSEISESVQKSGHQKLEQTPAGPVDEVHLSCERGLVLHGPGLTSGHVIACRRYEFYVDTRNASAGKLNVKVDGPGNVEMDLGLCDQGYSVKYSAAEAGEYQFTLRYDGQVLAGGPLRVQVLPPDAQSAPVRPCPNIDTKQENKTQETCQQSSSTSTSTSTSSSTTNKKQPIAARVTEVRNSAHSGPANPAAIQVDTGKLTQTRAGQTAELLVDCENAGEGKLEASLDGIRNPADQLLLSHVSNRVFKVAYIVNEPGEYKLVLRWAGQPLPGSPFSIIAS